MSTISNNDIDKSKAMAMKRWHLLGDVLRQKGKNKRNFITASQANVSVRRFSGFSLIPYEPTATTTDTADSATVDSSLSSRDVSYTYSPNRCIGIHMEEYSDDYVDSFQLIPDLTIRQCNGEVTLSDLIGFNNTGNVCMWPAEDALACYSLLNSRIFSSMDNNGDGISVCELGAGMTALAGLCLGAAMGRLNGTKPLKRLLLTDGNVMSVNYINANISMNSTKLPAETSVESSVLQWDASNPYTEYADSFDVLLAADCLFFDNVHDDLIHVIRTLLRPHTGVCFIVGPKRGNTLDLFVKRAREAQLSVIEEERFLPQLWQLHCCNRNDDAYDPDIHYPLLLTVRIDTHSVHQ